MNLSRLLSFSVCRGFSAAICVQSLYRHHPPHLPFLTPLPVSKSRTSKHIQVGQTSVHVPQPRQASLTRSQTFELKTFIMFFPSNLERSRCANGSFSSFSEIAFFSASTAFSSASERTDFTLSRSDLPLSVFARK